MKNKRPYHYIDLWKRKEIIECSITKSESIKKCAKRLGVKYITAKHIVKVYKETGKIETKIMQKEAVKQQYFTKSMYRDDFSSSQQFYNTSAMNYNYIANDTQRWSYPLMNIESYWMWDISMNQNFNGTNQACNQLIVSNENIINPTTYPYQMPSQEVVYIPVGVCGQYDENQRESSSFQQVSLYLGDEVFGKFKN